MTDILPNLKRTCIPDLTTCVFVHEPLGSLPVRPQSVLSGLHIVRNFNLIPPPQKKKKCMRSRYLNKLNNVHTQIYPTCHIICHIIFLHNFALAALILAILF